MCPNLCMNRRTIPCTICTKPNMDHILYLTPITMVCLHVSSKINQKLTCGTPLAANRIPNRRPIRTQNHRCGRGLLIRQFPPLSYMDFIDGKETRIPIIACGRCLCGFLYLKVCLVALLIVPHGQWNPPQFLHLLPSVVSRAPAQGYREGAHVVTAQVGAQGKADGLDVSGREYKGMYYIMYWKLFTSRFNC
jgi:hypothetical protein